MNTKNAFSVAQNGSKRMASEEVGNAINLPVVAGNLTVAGVAKAMNFGQPTARASRLPPGSPRNTVVAARPSTAICAGRASGKPSRSLPKPTSSWIPLASGAVSA